MDSRGPDTDAAQLHYISFQNVQQDLLEQWKMVNQSFTDKASLLYINSLNEIMHPWVGTMVRIWD